MVIACMVTFSTYINLNQQKQINALIDQVNYLTQHSK